MSEPIPAAEIDDLERQRQALLFRARQTPMANRLADAVITGADFDQVALLRAAAILEQVVLAGPRGLHDAEPSAIRTYPDAVAAYRELLDRYSEHQP